jgi:hypothetical protein
MCPWDRPIFKTGESTRESVERREETADRRAERVSTGLGVPLLLEADFGMASWPTPFCVNMVLGWQEIKEAVKHGVERI